MNHAATARALHVSVEQKRYYLQQGDQQLWRRFSNISLHAATGIITCYAVPSSSMQHKSITNFINKNTLAAITLRWSDVLAEVIRYLPEITVGKSQHRRNLIFRTLKLYTVFLYVTTPYNPEGGYEHYRENFLSLSG
jgi:hypothetical protein